MYDGQRKELLRSHPWNFAIKREALQLLTSTPAFEYSYEYQLPTDCLRVLKLYGASQDYVIEGSVLRTNETSPKLIYISDEEDTQLFDTSFSELLALAIAAKICYSITGSTSLLAGLMAEMRRLKAEAKQYDGQEGRYYNFGDGEWLDNFFDGV